MTQRIFDIENEKDYADLWDIVPENVYKLIKDKYQISYCDEKGKYIFTVPYSLIKINWHDKKEITRPMQEATEADIGKLCRFSLSERARCSISLIEEYDMFGILTKINNNGANTLYLKDRDIWFNHCRRLTKQEIEELI